MLHFYRLTKIVRRFLSNPPKSIFLYARIPCIQLFLITFSTKKIRLTKKDAKKVKPPVFDFTKNRVL